MNIIINHSWKNSLQIVFSKQGFIKNFLHYNSFQLVTFRRRLIQYTFHFLLSKVNTSIETKLFPETFLLKFLVMVLPTFTFYKQSFSITHFVTQWLSQSITHSLRHTILPNDFKTNKDGHFKLGTLDLNILSN